MYRCPTTSTPPPTQIVVEPFFTSAQVTEVEPEVAGEPPTQPIDTTGTGTITGYKDPLRMTREELMSYLQIDPAVEAETRRMVAEWRPESQINPDEVGRYYQVIFGTNFNEDSNIGVCFLFAG